MKGAKRKEPKAEKAAKPESAVKKERVKKEPKETPADGKKQTKIAFKAKKAKEELWESGTDEEDYKDGGDSDASELAASGDATSSRSVAQRDQPKRTTAATKKFIDSSDSEPEKVNAYLIYNKHSK